MNKVLAITAFLAAAAAPQLALAASQDAPQNAAQLFSAGSGMRFEIVDPSTGRTVAVLVPIAGSPGTLRLIRIVRSAPLAPPAPSAPPAEEPVRPIVPEPLTPGQMNEQSQREMEAQFHLTHDGG